MRNLIALSFVMLVAYGQAAFSADAGKPVAVAAPSSIPVGVLESFGAIGLAP